MPCFLSPASASTISKAFKVSAHSFWVLITSAYTTVITKICAAIAQLDYQCPQYLHFDNSAAKFMLGRKDAHSKQNSTSGAMWLSPTCCNAMSRRKPPLPIARIIVSTMRPSPCYSSCSTSSSPKSSMSGNTLPTMPPPPPPRWPAAKARLSRTSHHGALPLPRPQNPPFPRRLAQPSPPHRERPRQCFPPRTYHLF